MMAADLRFVYDGSFAGFLSVVFEATRRGVRPAGINVEAEPAQGGLFAAPVRVTTVPEHAERVRRGLEQRIRPDGVERLYHAFLGEVPDGEQLLFRLIERILEEQAGVMEDLRFPPALAVERLVGRVRREVHRMHAFVRFEQRQEERYVAYVRPDHNVLPLLGEHFAARYPAMHWAIVDAGRNYALRHVPTAARASEEPVLRFVPAALVQELEVAPEEAIMQTLWRTYFRAVTIPERRNLELQRRHVPRRYWPYLIEKCVPTPHPVGTLS